MKTYFLVSVLTVLAVVSMGCAQNRMVLTPQSHDMTICAPPWAQANGLPATEGMVFFVGVSQEQVTSEAEAIEQAHRDALRKVNDYLGLQLGGQDSYVVNTATTTASEWPYRVQYMMNFMRAENAQISRSSEEKYAGAKATQFNRNNWVAYVNIIDTWVVSERFSGPRPANQMRYGELWKAKVLAALPEDRVKDMADYTIEAMRHEYEYARMCMEKALETAGYRDQTEWEANFELSVREREMELEMRQREFDAYLDYRVAAGQRFLEIERPTFNFMNNTYLYGTVHPFPGHPFVPCKDVCD